MGLAEDAEYIPLDDLTDVVEGWYDGRPESITYLGDCPRGRCESVYCRYAMSANTREGGYSIVSIEPHLLGSSLPRFYAPGIQTRLFDLTPEVAGPSEGFIEAGVAVHAIFGSTDTIRATICSAWLEEDHPNHWVGGSAKEGLETIKHWYEARESLGYYSSQQSEAFEDSDAILLPDQGHFKIAIIAGHIRLPSDQIQLRLEVLSHAIESPLNADCFVLTMPIGVLESPLNQLLKSIYMMLERGMSIHMRPFSVQALDGDDIAQVHGLFVLVALRSCSSFPWDILGTEDKDFMFSVQQGQEDRELCDGLATLHSRIGRGIRHVLEDLRSREVRDEQVDEATI